MSFISICYTVYITISYICTLFNNRCDFWNLLYFHIRNRLTHANINTFEERKETNKEKTFHLSVITQIG